MNKEEQINKTLDALKEMRQAEPPPFFYTRLKARMERELEQKPELRWALKPAFVIPVLVLTVALNVTTVLQFKDVNSNTAETSAADTFAQEYNLNTTYGVELY